MILNLLPDHHPMLKQEMQIFDFNNPPTDPIQLANDLIETLTHYKAIGLSANQCGLPYRVFVMWSSPTKVCFNPRTIDETTEQIYLDEGCLTFSNLFIKIKRPKIIKVRYQDVFGEMQNEKFIGMSARCFLHELDHLNGVLFTERANSAHLARARNQKKHLDRNNKKGLLWPSLK